jgi:hypothetical protein
MVSRHVWRLISTGVLVLLLLGLAAPSPAATRGQTPPDKAAGQEPALCQITAPSEGEVSVLTAVTDVPFYTDRPANNTMWAVGYTSHQAVSAQARATLTLYFNGRTWQRVPSPNLAAENVLTGVAAYSENDVWAVGYAYDSSGYTSLILHFNGAAWTVWHEPAADWSGPWDVRLNGVKILPGGNMTDREAVAVGYIESMHGPLPLVMHYDGSTWKRMSLPPSMDFGRLYAVAGESLDNLWAVGTLRDLEGGEGAYLFHHTTQGWTPIVKGEGTLTSLAIAGDRIFTAGHVRTFDNRETATLVMAYTINTGDWVQVKAFSKPAGDNVLTAITSDGARVYAVGYTTSAADDARRETLVLAYDGTTFLPLAAPNPDVVNELQGVVLSRGVLWAVGTTGHGPQRSTLVLNNNCVTNH